MLRVHYFFQALKRNGLSSKQQQSALIEDRLISLLKNHPTNTPAFSLVELLVVVALIGLISLFALPSVTSFFKISLSSATREMASIVKETYNSTMLTGQVHRIVWDLKENQFWVEAGPKSMLLDTDESREQKKRKERFKKTDESSDDTGGFSMSKLITRKKVSLPRGVEFEDLMTEQSPEPIKEGIAYTHFFPHGITEQTIIHLRDNSNHHITLVISALVGKTRLEERYLKREEVFEQ